ncbi:MAG: MBL fold metallo-hydrolase [Armatimonadota bacterium]
MGPSVRFSPVVRRTIAPNPSLMTGAGTNTYLVGAGDITVIDPGPNDSGHLDTIRDALRGDRVVRILLTHHHSDHAPGAAGLSTRTGAPVMAFPEIRDGDRFADGGVTLEALHTPGHASDHLCFFLHEEEALFSGDLIMSGSTVVIAPPDGDMAAYLRSLDRIRQRQPSQIYPGHGDVIESPAAVIEEYIQHRRARERQVLEALASGPARIPDLVSRIYVDVPAALHPLAAHSVYAHLIKLRAEGLVAGSDRESVWRLP